MSSLDMNAVREVFSMFADLIVERIAERDASLISQRDRRGLMGRRHIDMVRDRIARLGPDAGAYVHDRDYFLTPDALREELARGSGRADGSAAPATASPRQRSPRGKGPRAREKEEHAKLKRELESEMNAARR